MLARPVQTAVATAALVAIAVGAADAGSTQTAACCLANGSCVDVDEPGCEQQGGVPQLGFDCNGATCGACCFAEGSSLGCTSALATNCTAEQVRVFRGPGTSCAAGACTTCTSCTGDPDAGCASECMENASAICANMGCVQVAALDTCDDGSCETSGCCQLRVADGGGFGICLLSDPMVCTLGGGEFHPDQTCSPDTGLCEPEFCCRCTGDNPDVCGGGECQKGRCTEMVCPPDSCVRVITTGTCDSDGCTPTGCCSAMIRDLKACIESDAETCQFAQGTFVPGATCDPSSGQCQGGTPTATSTSTATMPTATATMTATATATAAPTTTRVPEGGACMDTSECAPALLCANGICTAVNVPAPTTSGWGLLIALGSLVVIAALSMRRFVRRRS